MIRRVTFDLIGLPPEPEEIADFLADRSPDAFARVVDRLLASPHYGEHWGRHWMDVVRYADTAGDNADYPIPEAVRYRDYIIDSLNADKPYDRMVREHLAGDILAQNESAENYAESVIATGFLALSRRYATAPFELWHLTLEDTIDTTGRAFLGLTLRAARCHDHKFDPVSQRDYYSLYGIFASTTFPYAGSEELQSKSFPRMNFVPVGAAAGHARPSSSATRSGWLSSIARRRRSNRRAIAASKKRAGELRAEWSKLRRASLPADVPGCYAVSEGKPVDVPLQRRGDPDSPGEVVPRGVPRFAFLAAEPARSVGPSTSGRLELADWLAQAGSSADGPRDGEPDLAVPFRPGDRGDPVQLRHSRRAAHSSRAARLARREVRLGRLVDQKAAPRDSSLARHTSFRAKPTQPSQARDPDDRWLWRFPPAPAGRRVDPRRDAGRLGQARTNAGRARIPSRRSKPGTGPSTTRSRRFTPLSSAAFT